MRGRVVALLIFVFLAAIPLIADWQDNPFLISLWTRIVIVGIAVVFLDLVQGYSGLPSFGHAAFFGLGGYTVAIIALHGDQASADSWFRLMGREAAITIPLAVAASAVAGLLIGAIALRTRGIHFIMITLALSQMLYFLFFSLPNYGGDEGLRMAERQRLFGQDISNPMVFYYIVLAALIASVLLLRLLVNSRFGNVIIGCAQNERRMKFLGYPVNAYFLAAFVISGAGTGFAGALMANSMRHVSPQMLSWHQSGEFMVMLVLGGMGSLYGGLVGAAAFLLGQEWLVANTDHWELLLGIALLIFILSSSAGVFGLMAGRRRPHD
ncbi:MAG: branched-chain amino acid ABC transporter permease [Pseudorhodoplanes sp.]|uniref:branched-chain amino acid ABC transporter permease n=1 Tax=Pseudorhodoplanes sp. TaxID=1934341 RepID=UPI003D1399F3